MSEKKEFQDKVVVVTGGAHGIGKCVAEEFEKQGAKVVVIDILEGSHYVGDLSKKEELEAFAEYVIREYGHVDYLINNAVPLMKGIDACSYEEFQYALAVGVMAPFYLLMYKSIAAILPRWLRQYVSRKISNISVLMDWMKHRNLRVLLPVDLGCCPQPLSD